MNYSGLLKEVDGLLGVQLWENSQSDCADLRRLEGNG